MKSKGKESTKGREFAVILEKIYSEIKIIGEDLSTFKKRVDSMFEELGSQKEGIFIIKADIRIMKSDVQVLKEDVSKIKTDIAEIKTDFGKRLTHLEALK